MLTDNWQLIFGLSTIVLGFSTILFTLVRWLIKVIKEEVADIRIEIRTSNSDSRADLKAAITGVREELLTLRTGDLQNIYYELREMRKAR